MSSRRIEFFDGFTSETTPDTVIPTTIATFAVYANDAAYESALSAGSNGDVYYNSTTDRIRKFVNGAWQDDNAIILENVLISDTTESTTKDTGALIVEGGVGIEKNLNVGGDAVITGDLTVSGTTTTIDTANLNVTDTNITINDTGNDATSEGAGITVERTGTDGSIIYEDAATSKFKAGALGSEVEIADISSAQDISNKAIKTPSQLDAKQDTKANLDTYASTASNGQFCFATDEKLMYQVVDSVLTAVGGASGGGDINQVKAYKANDDGLDDFTQFSVDNPLPDFDGSSAFGANEGDFAASSTGDALLSNDDADAVYKFTAESASQWSNTGFNLSVPKYIRGRDLGLQFQYRTKETTGDSTDASWMVWVFDQTNGVQTTTTSTGAQAAGTSLTVGTSTGMAVGDKIWIGETGGTDGVTESHITAIADSTHVTLADAVTLTSGDRLCTGVLTDVLTTIDAQDSDTDEEGATYKLNFRTATDTASVTICIQQLTSQTDAELYLDAIEVSSDPFKSIATQGMPEEYSIIGGGDKATTNTTCITFVAGTERNNTLSSVGSVADTDADGFSFTATVACMLNISTSLYTNAATSSHFGYSINSTGLTTYFDSLSASQKASVPFGDRGDSGTNTQPTPSGTSNIKLNKGDVVRVQVQSSGSADFDDNSTKSGLYLTATPLVNQSVVVESTDAVISDWTDFDMTISATTTAPTKPTSPVEDNGRWRRVGDSMEVEYQLEYTTATASGATSGSGDYIWHLPSGYYIDTAKVSVASGTNSSSGSVVGNGFISDTVSNAASTDLATIVPYDNYGVKVFHHYGAGRTLTAVNDGSFALITGDNRNYKLRFTVPIAGWSATASYSPLLSLPTVTYGQEPESCYYQAHAGYGSTNTYIPYFTNAITDSISNLGTITNDSTSGFAFTATARCKVTMKVNTSIDGGGGQLGISLNSSQLTTAITSITAADAVAIVHVTGSQDDEAVYTGILESGDVLRPHYAHFFTPINTARCNVQLLVEPIQGVTNQAAIIAQPVCYIKDHKTSGTGGGTATSGAWRDRELNTLSGDIAAVGITTAGNMGTGGTNVTFTLPAGKYKIAADAPAIDCDGHKIKLLNSTDTKDVIIGSSAKSHSTDLTAASSFLKGVITITKSTDFKIQHRVETTGNFGEDTASIGTEAVYTTVEITRMK